MSPANAAEYERLSARLRELIEAAERAEHPDGAELRLTWGGAGRGGRVRGTWRCDPDLLEKSA